MQRIRLRTDELGEAVEAVRSFVRVTGTRAASWWLSEHSTPADVEERLLAYGLRRVESDYRADGMLLVTPPPPAEVEVRPVANAEEYVGALLAQYDAFEAPPDRRQAPDELAEEYELERRGGVVVTYVARLDGRIAGMGRAAFTPRGALMFGGATAPWARGRGAYRALVRARWDEAAARGTPALAVQAGAMSAPILARLGFETVHRFRRLEDVASTP